MPDTPVIRLPARGHFGPRVQVEFERDILLAIIEAAAPELGRLDQLRMDGKLDGEATDEKLKRAAGVASNDLVRLSNALKDLELP